MVQFHANTVVVDESDDTFILVGFADEAGDCYRDVLMLQRAYQFDEQDIALGEDLVYIERNEQSRSGYGGIVRFELHRDRILVSVDSRMAGKLGDSLFEISFSLDDAGFEALRTGLRTTFEGFGCLVEHSAWCQYSRRSPAAQRHARLILSPSIPPPDAERVIPRASPAMLI